MWITRFFSQLASELPIIKITINQKQYAALIDTGASFSTAGNRIDYFKKAKLNLFTTLLSLVKTLLGMKYMLPPL